jgi:hypothetical protein
LTRSVSVAVLFLAAGWALPTPAQVPAVPTVPEALLPEMREPLLEKRDHFSSRRTDFTTQGLRHNEQCHDVQLDTSLEKFCIAEKRGLVGQLEDLRAAATTLQADIDAAVASEEAVLGKRIDVLNLAVKNNLDSINQLGFSRREADFEAWVKLSEDSQREFQTEVFKEGVDVLASRAQDKILGTFKELNQDKANRLISWIENDAAKHGSPVPVETINVIRRLSGFEPKEQLARDAKYLLTAIDATINGMDVQDLSGGMSLALDVTCELVPEDSLSSQCEVFRSISKLTVASLYNNANQHVASHEIGRLTEMTENELRGLNARSCVLHNQMNERNRARARLAALKENGPYTLKEMPKVSCVTTN